MKVQEFQADSVSEALSKVYRTLGNKAVILDTQTFPGGKGVLITAAKQNPHHQINRMRSAAIPIDRTLDVLRKDIAQIREVILQGSTTPDFLPPGVSDVDERLRDNGVGPHLRRRIVELVTRTSEGIEAFDAAVDAIEDLVPVLPASGMKKRPRILAFVGPTGVGKTTTIAKLAGRLAHEAGKKVAFMTVDTYRVAAVEQLRAYADMLSAPIEVIFTPADAGKAVDRFSHYDVILIDTTGRGPFDASRLHEINGLLNAGLELEIHLVLSATTSPDVAEEILDRYGNLDPVGIVLSKLDETKKPGNLMELIATRAVPLSFLTTGQEVPADLERATGEGIARRLLANTEKKLEASEAEL